MPKPKPGESQNDYVERCIPIVISEGIATDGSQAAAVCHSLWHEHHKPKAMKKQSYFAVKSCQVKQAVKDVDTKSRTVTGFYNTYNFLDSDGDVLLDGAAKKSIKERGVNSDATAKIKHALNHDLTQLPGKIVTLDEREIDGMKGIYFETRMADTTLGNDTLKNYLEGVYDNHSIGFNYDKYDYIERDGHGNSKQWDNMMGMLVNPEAVGDMPGILAVHSIKLWEGSTVAFGANSLTPFLGMAKSMTKEAVTLEINNRMQKLNRCLQVGTQSDEMLHSIELQFKQLQQLLADLDEYIVIKKQIEKPEPQQTEAKHAAFSDAFFKNLGV